MEVTYRATLHGSLQLWLIKKKKEVGGDFHSLLGEPQSFIFHFLPPDVFPR